MTNWKRRGQWKGLSIPKFVCSAWGELGVTPYGIVAIVTGTATPLPPPHKNPEASPLEMISSVRYLVPCWCGRRASVWVAFTLMQDNYIPLKLILWPIIRRIT